MSGILEEADDDFQGPESPNVREGKGSGEGGSPGDNGRLQGKSSPLSVRKLDSFAFAAAKEGGAGRDLASPPVMTRAAVEDEDEDESEEVKEKRGKTR